MLKITFEDFIYCFKKQFLLQKGKGGQRISPYYTNYNQELKLKNDTWGIMVFIHCGTKFGFTDKEMVEELRIKPSLYEVLKEVTPQVLQYDYPDKRLHVKVKAKINLVNNCVYINFSVKPCS